MVNPKYHFASDNTAGICPEVWEAMQRAGTGFAPSYGEDAHTRHASDLFRDFFECDCDVYFVFNGTAANSLALATLCQSYHSVITHETSHIETDECGAPEFFSNGTKLLLAPGPLGKLDPVAVEQLATKRRDLHFPKPRALSFSCPTELGTVYTPAEIGALGEIAQRRSLRMHLDGARFFNALASLKVSPAELTWKAGVDVLSCGGVKLGGGLGEAVVFFDRALGEEFAYRCKQAGQLASKMRYFAAGWCALLENGVWQKYAASANRCAQLLAGEFQKIPEARVLYPVEANGVFVELPPPIHAALQAAGWVYYAFIGGGSRFMCSWATTESDVRALIADAQSAR